VHRPERDNRHVDHGAADTCIGLATARCSDVLEYLFACPAG
jgi:predicted GH43/DUF377 family glycosyl hydrolase